MSTRGTASDAVTRKGVAPWPDLFPRYTRLALPLAATLALLGDVGLGGLYLLNQFLGTPVAHLTEFVSLNAEANLPTWYSSVQWFAVAALLAVFVYQRTTDEKRTWVLWALPAVVLLFSLDEMVTIHEFVGFSTDELMLGSTRRETVLPVTGSWIIVIGIPFIIAAVVALFYMRRFFKGHERALRILVAGLVIMLSGAVGVETISNFMGDASDQWPRVLAEEMLELVGASIMLWGAYTLVFGDGPSRSPTGPGPEPPKQGEPS